MSLQAFRPYANSFLLPATDTAAAAVQVSSTPPGCFTYQFVNDGSNKVYFAWGSERGVLAAIPAAGTPANGIVVLPNEIVIYNLGPNAWISVICPPALTGQLRVTPGEGM